MTERSWELKWERNPSFKNCRDCGALHVWGWRRVHNLSRSLESWDGGVGQGGSAHPGMIVHVVGWHFAVQLTTAKNPFHPGRFSLISRSLDSFRDSNDARTMQLAFAGNASSNRMQQTATYSLVSPDPAVWKRDHSRRPGRKKRKATNIVRKEEKDALQEKLLALEAELAGLKAQTLTPEGVESTGLLLRQSIVDYGMLKSTVQQQQLGIANIRSMFPPALLNQHIHPLYTRICLKKEWAERRATLLSIRDEKLTNAYRYVSARSRLIRSAPKQSSDERFETADGDFCCVRFECVRFAGVQSIQQVFDAFLFYQTNSEISISERLGHIAVRDDYDHVEGRGFNARVISTESSGITTETNTIAFSRMFNEENLSCGGVEEPCGIMTCDFVDEDELYPYRGSEHVQKDVSGAVVLTSNRAKVGNASQDPLEKDGTPAEELVVTMHRAVFIKLHRPQFAVSEAALQDLYEGIARWGDVMLQTVRSIVYAAP